LGLYLWNNGSPQLLGWTTVTAGTPTNSEINGYFWAPLNPPLLLSNNTQYLMSAQTFSGVDDWGGLTAATNLNSYFATSVSAYYLNGTTWPTPPTLGGYGGDIYTAPNMASLTNFLLAEVSPTGNVTVPASSSFTLTAYGAGPAPLYYPQWYFNGAALAGQTNATLTLSPLNTSSAGSYYVVLSNYQTSITVTSAVTTLQVPSLTVLGAGKPIWNQTSQTNIIVYFSYQVDPSTATNSTNYSLNNGASVLSAALVGASNEVVLTTSVLNPGTSYTLTIQGVNDAYGDTLSPSPANLTVGLYPTSLALWLEGGEGVTVDGNGYANQWNDQSANANNMFQPSGDAWSPFLVANGINGLPALYFEATNLYNYMYASPSASLGITGDMSVFAVMAFSNINSAGNTIFSKSTVNLASPYDYYVTSTTVNFYRGNGTTYGVVKSSVVPSIGVPHVLDVVMQGTTVTHRLDGNATATGTLSTTIADNASEYAYIGARDDGTNLFDGQLAELIVLGAAADSYDTAAIENYLGAKYGILFGSVPAISVTQSAGNVVLSWPTSDIAFTLKSTPTLSPTAWTTVTNTPVISGDTNTVTLPASANQMFYRLQEQ